ncbi:MAG: VWA domain-containing protein [Planctomycetota bacterium]
MRRKLIPIALEPSSQGSSGNNADLVLYLLRDAATAPIASHHLDGVTIDASFIPLLIQLHRAGDISETRARQLVLHCATDGLLHMLADELADAPKGAASKEAVTRWLLELFWNGGNDEQQPTSPTFPRGLFAFLLDSLDEKTIPWISFRFARLCHGIAASCGGWHREAAEICVLGLAEEIPRLLDSTMPHDVFRKAVRILYRRAMSRPELEGATLNRLLQHPICVRPSGQLDLDVIGALLHLRRTDGFNRLFKIYSINRVVAGFNESPHESVRLFCYPGSEEKRSRLVHAIFSLRSRDPKVLAVMLAALPPGAFEFTKRLTGQDVVRTLRELFRLEQGDEWSFSVNKANAIGNRLSDRLVADQSIENEPFAEFMEGWLTRGWSEQPNIDSVFIDQSVEAISDRARFRSGVEVLTCVARRQTNATFTQWLADHLSPSALAQFISVLPALNGLSYAFEVELARCLESHANPVLSEWACGRSDNRAESVEPIGDAFASLVDSETGTAIGDRFALTLASASGSDLVTLVKPLIGGRRTGIVAALSEREVPHSHEDRVWCCVALLTGGDPPQQVAEQITRFADRNERALHGAVSELSLGDVSRLGTLGLIMMYRWEGAAFAFGDRCLRDSTELLSWMHVADQMPSKYLGHQLIQCLSHVIALFIARQPARAEWLLKHKVLATWMELLPTRFGSQAAGVLVRAFKSKLNEHAFVAMESRALEIIPSLGSSIQFELRCWVNAGECGPVAVTPRLERVKPNAKPIVEIARCQDLDRLTEWLADETIGIVADATVRLIELGDAGVERILRTLELEPSVPCAALIAETVSLWPLEYHEAIREMVDGRRRVPNELRFLLCVNALELFPSDEVLPSISELFLIPCSQSWVHVQEMTRVVNSLDAAQKRQCAENWIESSHPHVYRFANAELIASLDRNPDDETRILTALVRFLRLGTDRDGTQRVKAAVALALRGDWSGYPILLANWFCNDKERSAPMSKAIRELPAQWIPTSLLREATQSCLIAGPQGVSENSLDAQLARVDWSEELIASRQLLLKEATDENVRRSVARDLRGSIDHRNKLRRVARAFHRGIEIGRELTGRVFRIEMIGGSQYGYTRVTEDRLFINPMPLLNGTPDAEDIVEGLILHEYGHHLYHRGPEQEAVWRKAEARGMGRLLNLVADEHLERNLRARNETYGNQLKRLGSYAFNRGAKEMHVDAVLRLLGRDALPILMEHPPGVARDTECLRVKGGTLLRDLEGRARSFSRFFRALRLGLGNRHNDPKVGQALALFDKGFRKLGMSGLLVICERLVEIFGSDACMSHLTGDDLVADPDGDLLAKSGGLSDDELQDEIRRITEAPKSDRGVSGGVRVINVGDDLDFDPITWVEKLPFNPTDYEELSHEVASPAGQFREFLTDLGLCHVRIPRRTRGRQVDPSALRQLILRGDPRVLVAREPQHHNDLFLSVVIDCSGSMHYGGNMRKAQMFAAMMAEACRNLQGVDLRLFGFTDTEIFDAGDAARPAVAALKAGGGNNDAAALLHAASVASRSQRNAKVVVMISDGLPTECTTHALRGLVERLQRRRDLVCAQVAVQPLHEVCFPDYVELTESNTLVSARRFGSIVARLVKRLL